MKCFGVLLQVALFDRITDRQNQLYAVDAVCVFRTDAIVVFTDQLEPLGDVADA